MQTSKIWHLANGIMIRFTVFYLISISVAISFRKFRKKNSHSSSSSCVLYFARAPVRSASMYFMTYFPECHANTKKPHWCVLTEKQSTLNIFYIYKSTRSYVCSFVRSFVLRSLALSLSCSCHCLLAGWLMLVRYVYYTCGMYIQRWASTVHVSVCFALLLTHARLVCDQPVA